MPEVKSIDSNTNNQNKNILSSLLQKLKEINKEITCNEYYKQNDINNNIISDTYWINEIKFI